MAKRFIKYWLFSIGTLVLLVTFINSPVPAADELFLTGVVKRYDAAQGLVTVDVQSKSCPGTMSFTPEDATVDLEGSEGKKISFFIDTSVCDPQNIHTMRGITFLRGQVK